MRITSISIFLLCFFLAVSIFNNLAIFNSALVSPDVSAKINSTYSTFNSTVGATEGGTDTFGFLTVWSYVRMFWNTIKDFLGYSLFISAFLIGELGVPAFIAIPLQILIYIIYIISFFELVTQRRVD